MTNPFANQQNQSQDNSNLNMDDSHISRNFEKGKFDSPIVQKGRFGNDKFHTFTNVDDNGNVNDSGFNSKDF